MRGSREKCLQDILEFLDTSYPMLAPLIAPQIELPDTDEELDGKLEDLARRLCALRSDDAIPLEVIESASAAVD
jgi:hypothetical protein